mmetsp:Transcript_41801/g.129138  ORF Transcript_41801/g.129138 Transcript_41801/m.129138 type:complete len:151 (+) Transcript_41801:700-1152(+)
MPFGAIVNFDETKCEYIPKSRARLQVPPSTNAADTKRIQDAFRKFRGGSCTVVLASVLEPDPEAAGSDYKFRSRALLPFLIFPGETRTQYTTKLTKVREMPNCALTPTGFMKGDDDVLGKAFEWFKSQVHTTGHAKKLISLNGQFPSPEK